MLSGLQDVLTLVRKDEAGIIAGENEVIREVR